MHELQDVRFAAETDRGLDSMRRLTGSSTLGSVHEIWMAAGRSAGTPRLREDS